MAVVQEVLFFGSKTWVMNPWLDKSLKGFHHRAVRHMLDMVPRRQQDGTWVYKTIGEALTMTGLEYIWVNIDRHQNMIVKYIVTHTIMGLCMAAERKPGLLLYRRWREQPAPDTLGIRAGNAEAEGGG